MNLAEKEKKLEEIIKSYKSALIAFSGGVDSTLLLYLTSQHLGKKNVLALIADSETYPKREKEEAISFCRQHDIKYQIIYTQELKDKRFASNPENRCYFCKTHLFEEAQKIREKLGFEVIFEGSNLDDLKDFRPGRKAVEEKGILSPLLEAKLTKKEIRELSKKYNLPTYNKPSKACLASRIPYHTPINEQLLKKIDKAEIALENLGFKTVRVRAHENIARIEVEEKDFLKVINLKDYIVDELQKLGFLYITLDLEGYKTGSMNKIIKQ